ncbi:hypothetical protein EYV94_14870 [Puteibacter caeruleilacunae]|nr:hypothetical protein EYV94_14870 [Puteibacter caeruleilacunae]
MDKQSFNLNADFLGGFPAIFIKIMMAIILVFLIIILFNFLRDKFINKQSTVVKHCITDLLAILHKLCVFAGLGFIASNLLQAMFNEMSRNHSSLSFSGKWDNLAFGLIIIFIGIGFSKGREVIKREEKMAEVQNKQISE